MSNADILRAGTAKAKRLIRQHVVDRILIPMANDTLDFIVRKRIGEGHNMTGNTVNSYVVGVFEEGKLVYMRGSWESIPAPISRKVYFFSAGRQRWDGDMQEGNFPTRGTAPHNGSTEPERAIAFIQSYQANPQGWVLVVANGIEYATYEENVYNADTLTGTLDDFKVNHTAYLKPIPL